MTETCFKGQSKVELMEELVNCYVGTGTGICPFCTGVKGEDSFIKNHLKHCHIDNAVSFLNVLILPCRKEECYSRRSKQESYRSHFHCPFCFNVYGRKAHMLRHLNRLNGKCGEVKGRQSWSAKSQNVDSKGKHINDEKNRHENNLEREYTHDERSNSNTDHFNTEKNRNCKEKREENSISHECRFCGIKFLHLITLRRHGESAHSIKQNSRPSICVDKNRGIYMVAYSCSGLLAPIHVQKNIEKGLISCESDECKHIVKLAMKAGNPAFECEHLREVQFSQPCNIQPLDRAFLSSLIKWNVIDSRREQECINVWNKCILEGEILIAYADFGALGYAKRQRYFSVFSDVSYFCPLGRLRVTFDNENGRWSCVCPLSGDGKSCLHEIIAKWFLCQYNPELFNKISKRTSNNDGANQDEKFMMEYIMKKKMIPAEIKKEYMECSLPNTFSPCENLCPRCSQDLEVFKKFKATVYGFGTHFTGVEVLLKRCTACNLNVRFQEYKSGYHNFNNTTLLSLKLCVHILNSIKNHIAISACLKTLFLDQENIQENVIRNAFYHFCALQDHQYTFSCLKCGAFPSILIGDGNWKNTCLKDIESVKRPTGIVSESIDCESSWLSYKKEIIGRGICERNSANPWTVAINYHTISPWLGKKSRISDDVINTESQKGELLFEKPKSGPLSHQNVTHEDILKTLHGKDKNLDSLKTLCASLGVSNKGSMDDIINRLNEIVLFKEIHPKLYKNIQKCGGGIVHFRCTHGVCYFMKYLLRQESARDHVDGLLSFIRQPNVYISDIASQVAHHGENRKNGLFYPYKGMLYEYSEENLKALDQGKLQPVMLNINQNPDKFYSLLDRFHTKSKKTSAEKEFRNLKNCLDMKVNTSIAEQQNAQMARDRYFVCSMSTVNFMFISRLTLHLQNEALNSKFVHHLKRCCGDFEVDEQGIAVPVIKDRRLLSTQTKQQSTEISPSPTAAKDEMIELEQPFVTDWHLPHPADDKLPSQTSVVAEVSSKKFDDKSKSNEDLIEMKALSNERTIRLFKLDEKDLPEIIIAAYAERKIWLKGFMSLKPHSWIMDEAIEIYIAIVASQCTKKVYIMDSFLTKNILERNMSVLSRQLLSKVSFSDYELIVGIWNVNNEHWKLLVINTTDYIVYLLDPIGSNLDESKQAEISVSEYLKLRERMGVLETDLQFKSGIIEHPKQSDGFSCGLFVMKIAESVLNNGFGNISFRSTLNDLAQYRHDIAEKILEFSAGL
uniref:uncharacterized protein LOC120330648 isoform X3 n=1 Tax=Styela clava TaxID=7725 RepID=UPI001939546C|nr:uncharacterized protein LOC120330648 isoform X3 [Styela clava]